MARGMNTGTELLGKGSCAFDVSYILENFKGRMSDNILTLPVCSTHIYQNTSSNGRHKKSYHESDAYINQV